MTSKLFSIMLTTKWSRSLPWSTRQSASPCRPSTQGCSCAVQILATATTFNPSGGTATNQGQCLITEIWYVDRTQFTLPHILHLHILGIRSRRYCKCGDLHPLYTSKDAGMYTLMNNSVHSKLHDILLVVGPNLASFSGARYLGRRASSPQLPSTWERG